MLTTLFIDRPAAGFSGCETGPPLTWNELISAISENSMPRLFIVCLTVFMDVVATTNVGAKFKVTEAELAGAFSASTDAFSP